MMTNLEKEIRIYCKKYGYKRVQKIGLGALVECFYLKLEPNSMPVDFTQAVNNLGLSMDDIIVWEKVWQYINNKQQATV